MRVLGAASLAALVVAAGLLSASLFQRRLAARLRLWALLAHAVGVGIGAAFAASPLPAELVQAVGRKMLGDRMPASLSPPEVGPGLVVAALALLPHLLAYAQARRGATAP